MICSWGHLDYWHANSTLAQTSLVMGSSCTPTFHLHLSKQFQFLLLLAKFFTCPNIIVFQEITMSEGHFIEHSPSIMYSCTFRIHVKKATVAHKSIRLATTLNHLFRDNMPDTLICMLAHNTFRKSKKVTVSGHCTWPSSSCNSWDSSNAVSHQFTCANTTAFQQNRSYLWCCVLISLNTLETSSYMIPHLRTYMSTMKAASYICVLYFGNLLEPTVYIWQFQNFFCLEIW